MQKMKRDAFNSIPRFQDPDRLARQGVVWSHCFFFLHPYFSRGHLKDPEYEPDY